jgi:Type IV secretion-system coupling protein DNA-binding domain/TraM recognition site of TraD and TraG
MASLTDERVRHFYRWERRGRGWQSFPYPVRLEPPFAPFRYLRELKPPGDDGKHHTALSRFLERLSGKRAKPAPAESSTEETGPEPFEGGARRELVLLPQRGLVSTPALTEAWLKSLSTLQSAVSFELVGSGARVGILASAGQSDAALLSAQLQAFFPALEVEEGGDFLLSVFEEERDRGLSAVEFGLAREFVLPLHEAKSFSSPDPLTGIVGALAEARGDEVALVQVLFERVRAPWAGSILRSVTTPSGAPFFSNAPDFSRFAREKVSSPLFAVAIRAAVIAQEEDRLWTLLRGIGGALAGATRGANEFVPLGCEDLSDLLCDIFLRTTRRPGMLLSLPELLTLVHLPGREVEGIVRETARTKALPAEARGGGVLLGYNWDHGTGREARLSVETRMRHVHVVGASGTGKSTLLVSMILQDIAEGHGVGVLDPHGDLVDAVLGHIPANREEDVILFDPADPDYAVGWNILSAHSEAEREMLASDLVAAFRRLSTSWGDQMTAVLANAILVFLESKEGGTLSDLRRFLADQGFRKSVLERVADPHLRDFWTTEFPLVKGKPEGSILSRLDTLLRSRLVRGVVTASDMPLDFRRVVDEGRIFLARLSQGAIGEENAALLGSLLVSKIHQVSLLRQDRAEEDRRPFFLYLDEFQNVATPSMASLFSGVRKYRLGVTVAHQDLYQLRSSVPEVERSVLANAYTRISFQVGDEDARTLAKTLSFFTAEDLGNLGTGEAIVRIGKREQDFNLRTVPVDLGDPETLEARRRDIRTRALARWGVPRTEEPRPAPVPERPKEVSPPPVEKPPVEVRAPRPQTDAPPPKVPVPEPHRPGKGGPEHTYLQELVKRWAEERGFRAVVEGEIPGSRESIDVALYRGETRIACEISVTTPLEYEIGNIEKCLAAGFGHVVMVSLKKSRLAKLEKLLSGALSSEGYGKVKLFTPQELLAWLDGQPAQEEVGTVGGYKVKVRYAAPQDAKAKRVAEILAKSMQRLHEKP